MVIQLRVVPIEHLSVLLACHGDPGEAEIATASRFEVAVEAVTAADCRWLRMVVEENFASGKIVVS